jgi:hypothetical protein
MRHKVILEPAIEGLRHRLILLPLIALVGCGNVGTDSYLASWRRWAAGSAASTSRPRDAAAKAARVTPIPDDQSDVESATAIPSAASKEQAAAEALRASLKARSAAEAAKKASDQAVAASKEASEAAARAGNGSPAIGTSVPSSDAATPAPVIPGGSPSVVILSSAIDGTEEQNRARTVELIRGLDQSVAKIDPTRLDPDAAKRKELAASLVQSAHKALLQNDFLEANSLASKASVMLAPLMGSAPKADSSH